MTSRLCMSPRVPYPAWSTLYTRQSSSPGTGFHNPIHTRYLGVKFSPQKGTPMIRILVLCAMLFQASPQTALKPLIDNDRVTVWDVTGRTTAQPFDSPVLSLSC